LQAEASFPDGAEAPPSYAVLARVSPGYPPLPGRLPTCYSPVRRSPAAEATFAHDLHVLSTPPAFILSQDQTLQFESFSTRNRLRARADCFGTTVADSSLPLSSFQRTDDDSGSASRRCLPRPPVSQGRRIIGQLGSGVNPLRRRHPLLPMRRGGQPKNHRPYSRPLTRCLSLSRLPTPATHDPYPNTAPGGCLAPSFNSRRHRRPGAARRSSTAR
jgi:hypothetical protein